jgi:PAS domain S-box-containing protein
MPEAFMVGTILDFPAPRLSTQDSKLHAAARNAVTRALAESSAVADAASRVLSILCHHYSFEIGAFWEADQEGPLLRLRGLHRSAPAPTQLFEDKCEQWTFAKGAGIPGQVWATGEPVFIPDVTRDPAFTRQELALAEGLNSLYAFPVIAGEGVLGVIELFGKKHRAFDQALHYTLSLVGRELGHYVQERRAKEGLRDSEEQFRATFENAAVGIAHVAPDGSFLRVNKRLCEITGFTPEELRTKTFQDITHPSDLDADLANLRQMLEGEIDRFSKDKRYLRKDGSIVWARLMVGCVRKNDGQIDYFISVVKDISERKAAEIALRESEERFRALGQASSNALYRMSPDASVMKEANGQGFVADTPEATQSWLATYVPPDEQPIVLQAVSQALAARAPFDLEHRVYLADGTIGWIRSRAVPILDEAGNIREWFGAATNITEQKRAEIALRESEEQFRATFENAAVGIAHVAPDGSWLRVNKRLCEITGYAAEELLANRFRDITHPDDLAATCAQAKRMFKGEIESYRLEKRYLRKDGSIVWVRLTVGCVRKADRTIDYFIPVIEDISQQKRAEIALRQSQERLRLAVDAANLGLWHWDVARAPEAIEADARCQALFGRAADAPASYEIWANTTLPEDRAEAEAHVARALDPADPHDEYACQYRVKHADGKVLWLSAKGRAYFEPDPVAPSGRRALSLAGTVRDVTDAHRAEEIGCEQERRNRYLLLLEKRLQLTGDADAAVGAACEALGQELGASFVLAAEVQPNGVEAVAGHAWSARGDVAQLLGHYSLAGLAGKGMEALRSGQAVRVADTAGETEDAALGTLRAGSAMGVPLMRNAKLHAVLFVTDANPREWTKAEADLARETVNRAWQAVEKAQADALRESEAGLRHLGDSLPDNAVFRYTIDPDGTPRFLYISAGIEQLNGVRVDRVVRDASILFQQIPPEYLRKIADAEQRSARELSDFKMEVPMRRPDGPLRWMRVRARPRRMPDGRVIWDGVQSDITDRKQAEEALRESEERLRLANEAAGIGIFTVDIEAGCVDYSPELAVMLGFPGIRIAKLDDAFARVHRDDVSRARAQFEAGLSEGGAGRIKMDFRFVRPGGEIRWMTWAGRVHFREGPSGRVPFRIDGACVDITGRMRAQEAMRESEARFRGIFEHAATGIAIKDLEDRLQACNPAYAAMLGYSAEELQGLPCKDFMQPDDLAQNTVEQERLLAGEISSFESLTRYFKKQGGIVWGQRHVSLLRDNAGKPAGIIVLLTDMTQHKRHEEQITLLMREVNHRAKNMLTVVQSIARQTAATKPDDFIERFGERIEALAANQDLLVKNGWMGVDLGELVCSQLAHFNGLIGTRIKLKGSPILISAPAAQTIGMALHELATNAGKYGALSNGAGRVEVEWGFDCAEAGRETFAMSWREVGGPPVKPPERPGFGSDIIGSVAEASLSGKVELDFPPSGLYWCLRCPASEVVEASGPGL